MAWMCRQLSVSSSGYYAWKKRVPSRRAQEDKVLLREITAIHKNSRETYGSPRVLDVLKEKSFAIGRRRVARLMRENGIFGTSPRPYKPTTDSKHSLAIADNILNREFSVDSPDKVWAADITYVRTWEGWLYLAVVLDLFSRRVVGWSLQTGLQTDLVTRALEMALGRRMPPAKLLHHSDRGSQYASDAYRDALTTQGIVCSMSRKGNCWDNAVVESFFATLKKELLYKRPWPTRAEARAAIVEYIEVFYNGQRKHSTLGYLSPMQYEQSARRVHNLAA